ncbi:L-fuculose-phosphate aldolase [Scatolibacter rhodanostii]|uniref:L-fuculose-phosphate aldolase n=1 Tax=Scatolibacter rhodanostii TaxID=2014781 RepID=UPI00190E98E8|nr:L-fuculose-phosphate aldolase [Scatolibacter rhodanostii]
MKLMTERNLLIEYGKKLVTDGFTCGTGGNLSIYNREEKLMAITPSGIPFFEILPEDIVIMRTDGTIVEGTRKPSSEWVMHKLFYERRTDINSVIHAHTIYSTILAELRWDLPAAHYMIAVAGPNVRCAEYASFGTEELAENAYTGMIDRKAVLLANHGVLTGHYDIANAYNVLEEVEYCANIYYRAKSIGEPVILDDAEMQHMHEEFKIYGQRK